MKIYLPALVLLLAACTKAPSPPSSAAVHPTAPTAPQFQPSASIQDLMVSIVDPSADLLWNAVSSEVTAKGVVEQQPKNAEEWQALRRHAIALQEAGNLLQIRGRAVAHPGAVTEDSHVEGVSTPRQVQSSIDSKRADFDAAARRLHDAAGQAVAAIDRRDVQQFLLAGEKIDAACEHCHSVFWYPNAKGPEAQWPAPIKPR